LALPLALSACEIITNVDRTQIPDGNGAMAGTGATGASDAGVGAQPQGGGGQPQGHGGQPEGGGGQPEASAGQPEMSGGSGGAAGAPQGGGGAEQAGAGGVADMAGSGGAALAGSGGEAGQPSTPLGKIIYLTSTPKKANFGGVSAADALCNGSPPRPGTYKALLVDGSTRVACTSALCATNGAAEGVDWALAPNTQYVRADGQTVIGTTTAAGIFAFPLAASIDTNGFSYWTGLAADWTTSTDDCTGWTEVSGVFANEGLGDKTDDQAIAGVNESCSTLAGAFFACVEQ
jgi:hypothetical protein